VGCAGQYILALHLTKRGFRILALLIAERDKLNRAIDALQGTTKRRGRPPRSAEACMPTVTSNRRCGHVRRRTHSTVEKVEDVSKAVTLRSRRESSNYSRGLVSGHWCSLVAAKSMTAPHSLHLALVSVPSRTCSKFPPPRG
jgi:hypothetical protein